eukprot:tig00000378_g24493.t1
MGDSDVILRNALMPYGDWNRATADALPISTSSDSPPKSSATRPGAPEGKAARGGQGGLSARRSSRRRVRRTTTACLSGQPIYFRGRASTWWAPGWGYGLAGHAAGGRGGGGLGLATAGGLLSAYQALSQGKIGEAEFFDTFRDQMIMTVGSFGLQTGMSSALSALTKMRIGTVGGLGLSILAGAIAQVIVDIINGRSAEEIVKNFFKYPVDWATDTIQFIAELSQQIYDWGVETWGDEASQLRNRINRLEASWAPDFWVCTTLGGARMASLLAQELRLNEIKEPKELQAFIRALDNSINDYRGFGSTSLALSRLMRDLKQMIKEETKGEARLNCRLPGGLNRINHIEALRREFGSAIRHSGVSSNGGAQVAAWRTPTRASRFRDFRMQDWWEAEAFRNYGPS